MSNLLTSLAYIKACVDSGLSIWDSLVRLTLNVIREKSVKDVSSESFCREFTDYYGINIPIHPMNTIIGKMKKLSIIDDTYGRWQINFSKIDDVNIKTQNQEKFENFIDELKKYLKNKFNIDRDYDSVEKMFVGYINIYDSELLYSIETKSMLPEIAVSNADKYMVVSFIEWVVKNDQSLLKILDDILLSNIHLNSVFFIEKDRKLKLNRVFVYLDTRFILRLTGIEGKFRKEEYAYLLDILISNNCNLRIFDVHYNEVTEILNDCRKWLENKKGYNPKYASRALRYFVEHNYKVSDVLACQAEIDAIMKKYKIGVDTHNYEADQLNQYNIDENKLYSIITRLYNENNTYFENYNMDGMIWNDIKAISSIYRKRKGFNANSLQNVKAIFITNNRTLTKAVREYNESTNRSEKYTECVTDTYWGTTIWLNTAYKEDVFYTKKLIADSIALTELNPKLKEKYLNNIKEKKEKGEFSDSEYYLLREYSGASQYLKDTTFNDEDEYTDSLPEEIIEHFSDEAKKPLQEIIANNDEQINEKNKELLTHQQRVKRQIERIDVIARRFSLILLIGFGIILNIPSFILTFQECIQNIILLCGIRIVSLLIGTFFAIDGFTRIIIGKKLYNYKRNDLLKKWEINNNE
jgi:hypothetical protein